MSYAQHGVPLVYSLPHQGNTWHSKRMNMLMMIFVWITTSYCYSACPCVHVSSLHIHLDIAHNSSSYSLIIIIRSLSRSAGSFPSNIARRMLATILNKGEQRSLEKDENVRIIRSGGPLPTIQVKSSGSQTSSGSRPRPLPLPNAPPSNTDIALHNIGTNRGPSHARYNIRYQCLSSQGARDPRVRRPGVSVPCAPSPEFLVLTVIEESFEPIRFKTITKRCIPII